MVVNRHFAHACDLCHFLITHLAEKPQSEDLLAKRWQFRLDELHQPFQTVIIIHRNDLALHRVLQEVLFHPFLHRLAVEHVATAVAHGSHQVALHPVTIRHDTAAKQSGEDVAHQLN